jgi:hypothetical protein
MSQHPAAIDETEAMDGTGDQSPFTSHQSLPAAQLTDFQLTEWQRRQDIVASCLAAKCGERKGATLREMSRALGEPVTTIHDYLTAYRTGGPEALKPGISTGRPKKFQLTREEMLTLRRHSLERGSLALAVEWFAKDAACSPATRAAILATLDAAARDRKEPRWPQSLRRAGYVTAEERATFRGKKAMMNLESCDRRGLTWVDEQGNSRDLLPGALWESDDMSSNEPFRYTDPETGATQLGRQMLLTLDVFSSAYLGFTPIGRVRDAYRVEDIADHMLALVEAHGLPAAWRLERGVWENQFIDGIELADGSRWGGLDALFAVLRTWKSRGKGTIESSFNHLQNFIAHGGDSAHTASIGRNRGEFEDATKHYLRAQGGNPESAAKFWDIADCANAYVRATEEFNARPKKRRAHGREMVVPADQFRDAIRRECPASELWRFLPVKRQATVRQGALEMSVNHYPMPFRFRVNGAVDGMYLEHGYSVLVAFHPGKPELGCQVFNAETGTRNRDGHRFGAHLLTAPMSEDAPQFSLSRSEQDAFAMRRKAAAAVRTEFRAIMPAGRRAQGASIARDGRGNAVEVNRGERGERGGAEPVTSHQSPVTAANPSALPAHTRRAERTFDYDAEAARLRAEEDAATLLPT